jgi:hypothetical protein
VSKLGLTISLLAVSLLSAVLAEGGSCGGVGTVKGGRAAVSKTLTAGVWGGEHLRMDVGEGGASLEFDCASGIIERPVVLDGDGRFDVKGGYTPEHGGPIRRGEELKGRPARYVGRVRGETLTLTIVAADPEETIGEFTLTRGSEGRVMKCR